MFQVGASVPDKKLWHRVSSRSNRMKASAVAPAKPTITRRRLGSPMPSTLRLPSPLPAGSKLRRGVRRGAACLARATHLASA